MRRLLHICLLHACLIGGACAQGTAGRGHPSLFVSRQEGMLIADQLNRCPLLARSFSMAKAIADRAIAEGTDVPLPKDIAGGYTHNRHKSNYVAMYNAGLVHTITGEEKYAGFIRSLLLQYARMVPGLKKHPGASGSSPGRLFHQALNDANWLVYAALAYDCIYEQLSGEERKVIEQGVFRPLCNVFTQDLGPWFNLVHNHGVWACAAVGITGLALNDDTLVQQALYGTGRNGKGGLMAQLNGLFSPDGYYTEGPYYARYALLPFYMFALALHHSRPEMKIFEHRGQILRKALYAALQQTNSDGAFFPLNDAIKDKTYITPELIPVIDIAYTVYGEDEALLGIATAQRQVLLNSYGVKVADAVAARGNAVPPFPYASAAYTDGHDGKEGGIAILRSGARDSLTTLVFKYTSHGLSHGHYDRLNLLLYSNGNEILQDYGAVRFLNVEQKDGGRYLPENRSFAMQTIAHNTLVVDETSHFNAGEKEAEQYHPALWSCKTEGAVQFVSAVETHAYRDVSLHRTLYLVENGKGDPVIIDIFRTASPATHQYDLPFYYKGQLIATSWSYQPDTSVQTPLGRKNGYQHLWKEATGQTDKPVGTFTFRSGRSFYSVSSLAGPQTIFYNARTGATDPRFNLRREPCVIVRKTGPHPLFVTVIEQHGQFDPVNEISSGSRPATENIAVLKDDERYTAVRVRFSNGKEWIAIQSNQDNSSETKHTLTLEGKPVSWTGPLQLIQHIP